MRSVARWWWLLPFGLSACSFEEAAPELVENRCSSDADCPGAICDVGTHMCITPTSMPWRIAVEVTPGTDPLGASPATQTFGPYDVAGGPARQDLPLAPSINVIGNVSWGGTDDPIQATVKFTLAGEFEGAPPITRETNTLATPIMAADGEPADFGVRVVQNRRYDIVIEPTGTSAGLLPPLRTTREVPGGGDFVRINFEYPAELVMLKGVVIGADETPVDGLHVQAVEIESGRAVSSIGVTGSGDVPGAFELNLDPEAAPFVLRIRGGPDRPLFPTLFADPAYFFPDETGYARILVPMLSRIRYRGRVTPRDDPEGVENAVLTFRSVDVFDDTTGVTSSFKTTATTDRAGVFEVDIFPGTYDIVVTPPPEMREVGSDGTVPSQLGVLFETLRILAPATGEELVGQTFELPRRARLGGTVQTSDERPIPGATVQALALNRMGESRAAPYNRSGETVTDATGQFTLPLDLGAYDVIIKPPAGSNFPWRVAPAMVFGSSVVVQNTFEIGAPVPLNGVVIGPGDDASGMAGAEVQAFAIVEEEGGAVRAIPVARTMSREDGSYTLLLPPRL